MLICCVAVGTKPQFSSRQSKRLHSDKSSLKRRGLQGFPCELLIHDTLPVSSIPQQPAVSGEAVVVATLQQVLRFVVKVCKLEFF